MYRIAFNPMSVQHIPLAVINTILSYCVHCVYTTTVSNTFPPLVLQGESVLLHKRRYLIG